MMLTYFLVFMLSVNVAIASTLNVSSQCWWHVH